MPLILKDSLIEKVDEEKRGEQAKPDLCGKWL